MQVDPFKATETSETEKESGGSDLPVKEKLTFTAPERKSRLGMMSLRDLLAIVIQRIAFELNRFGISYICRVGCKGNGEKGECQVPGGVQGPQEASNICFSVYG